MRGKGYENVIGGEAAVPCIHPSKATTKRTVHRSISWLRCKKVQDAAADLRKVFSYQDNPYARYLYENILVKLGLLQRHAF
jgi:hypothetical protein